MTPPPVGPAPTPPVPSSAPNANAAQIPLSSERRDSRVSRMTTASESTLASSSSSAKGQAPTPASTYNSLPSHSISTSPIPPHTHSSHSHPSTTPTDNTPSPSTTTSSLPQQRHGLPHGTGPVRQARRPRLLEWMRSAALNTPPSFFSINMGCGIASILLHNYPYPAVWLRYLGTIVFVLNVVVFVLLLLATIARYLVFSGVWGVVAKHNVAGLFWGCFPMGFVTIVNMICFVCVPGWGRRWAYIALGFWWLDIVVAVFVSLGMMFVMFTRQRQTVQSLAPQWLLPIVSCVVAAASGGVVAETLMPFNANLARGTLVASYCVWGLGVPLAMMIIALLVFRFATGGAPSGPTLAAVFLPLGPCGQGSYGIVTLGLVAKRLVFEHDVSIVPGLHGAEARALASAMYAGGLVTGFILFGLALAWYTIGMALFWDGVRRDVRLLGLGNFTVSLWALTFPIGVFATSAIALADQLHSTAFRVIGAFLATQVILHWVYVSVFTLWKVIQGTIFVAPELRGLEGIRSRWHVARDLEAGYGDTEAADAEAEATAAENGATCVPLGPTRSGRTDGGVRLGSDGDIGGNGPNGIGAGTLTAKHLREV